MKLYSLKILIKLLVLVSLLSSLAYAQNRPKIGLVLSGGGARGGAHVGVLKVLEEKKIPIDFIVGTSMGSFVGGLYASGKTPQEIETLLTTTEWEKYIRTDFNRQNIPMRKKAVEYQYQGRIGFGVNANDDLVMPTGVLKRQPMLMKFLNEFEHVDNVKDFDKLPIPFRAVATDISNGEAIILKSGSLGKSVYASSAIPGGFQPIDINGINLVDGGVSKNMPIQVARDMGADIIIAVDVSENFDKKLDVNSYLVVMGQLVNILMRKNANESIATLTDKDILLTPNLDGFTGLDADKYVPIIQTGVDVTQKEYASKLQKLSLNEKQYALYKSKHKPLQSKQGNAIDQIVLKNPTYLNNEMILGRLDVQIGDVLDEDKLRDNLMNIYNLGTFDSVNYDLIQKDGKNILEISTIPSWDNHGEIRFSVGLEDDFDGHSSYSLKLGYTKFGLNDYGGEWKNDIEIGRRKMIYTEFFQPLDPMQRVYIKPSLIYSDTRELVPVDTIYHNGANGLFEVEVERQGASLALGTHIFTYSELEFGTSLYRDKLAVNLLDFKERYDARPLYGSLKIDTLDNLNFEKEGVKLDVVLTKEMKEMGSDYDYEQLYVHLKKPINYERHTLTTYLKYGTLLKKDGLSAMADAFTLGGLFNLSGYVPYSLMDDNMFLGALKYRYQIKDGGFFGSLAGDVYVGFSAEIGNTWAYKESISYEKMHKSGTVFLAADTILGPFYIAYGFANSRNHTAYLYLGEKF